MHGTCDAALLRGLGCKVLSPAGVFEFEKSCNTLPACVGECRYRQLRHLAPAALRNSDRAFYTDFIGEHADDYGGPYREALSLVAGELSETPLLKLLQVCACCQCDG